MDLSGSQRTAVTENPDQGTEVSEVARLRARVAELETRLVEVEDWANRTVGAAQERLYWLDLWHIDLNALMERRGASQLRAAIRAARFVYRLLFQLERKLTQRR
jgi:hypothetical protein